MPNTRDIRRRIKSVKNTAQITKAMQMVAASRMRKAQQKALAGRPYAELLDEMTARLHANSVDLTHPLLIPRPVKTIGTLIISTDKGLAGALNANLLREVLKDDKGNRKYVTIGRKGRQFIARMGKDLAADFELKENFSFTDTKRVSAFLLNLFEQGEIDEIEVYHSFYKNVITQIPQRTTLVPIGLHDISTTSDGRKGDANTDYDFEPNAQELLGKLLPYYVHLEVYQRCIDARASEHSARMVAMKNATDNAKQLIKDLSLEYNKVRQAGITNEILEISSAAAAMS